MAELEILNALVGVLCPTSEAASTCNQFISSHSNILPPVGPIVYFLLFPAVFTILFIMILMSKVNVARDNRVKLLVGITAFIFIIISGYYPIMLILSEFWYLVIVLLGFIWFVTGHFGRGDDNQGGQQRRGGMPGMALGGAMDALEEAAIKNMDVEEKRVLYERFDTAIMKVDSVAAGLEAGSSDAWRSHSDALKEASDILEEFKTKRSVKIMGITVAVDSGIKEKIKALHEAKERLNRAVHSYRGKK